MKFWQIFLRKLYQGTRIFLVSLGVVVTLWAVVGAASQIG